MISLEEYKNYLISYCHYKYDDNEDRRKERMSVLSRKFSDEMLQKVIIDTYEFIGELFDVKTNEYGYALFELDSHADEMLISLGLIGGGFSDTLFVGYRDLIISRYILKQVFGITFEISMNDNEIWHEDGDVRSTDYTYDLYLSGFPKNMSEIKERLFGETKSLKMK